VNGGLFMAQVLKENQRKAILEAAKAEFFHNGFEKSSMRSIAKDASMTVGNLYRYFRSKEVLGQTILTETLDKINQLIEDALMSDPLATEPSLLTTKRVDFFQQRIESFSAQLVEIFMRHRQEFIILIYHAPYAHQVIEWFKSNLLELVVHWFPKVHHTQQQIELLCYMIAESIVAGLSRGFKETISMVKIEEIQWIIATYLNLYTLMLTAGEEAYEKT